MPIYEYRCAGCGHVFETIQSFSDPDPESCPSCNQKQVSRLISRSSFHLQGGGWYAQDYSSQPAKGLASESANPASSGESSPIETTTSAEKNSSSVSAAE